MTDKQQPPIVPERIWEEAIIMPGSGATRHTHNCPNCFFFFEYSEPECVTDYSKCCNECWERNP